jgi:hypothetical protein
VEVERSNVSPDLIGCEAWTVAENGKQYWVTLRRSQYGPHWEASVFVEPRSDQKPYWRPLKNWQRFACAVRVFENQK